ncbi:hypothetical protein LCGC14_1227940 [marine sediment metagenome]|uniref:Uncharacterized protein n=1 Tax=marine sediment metagenome TaxID=412755 RepID=A0A0F9NRM2_9ZZZZ|nr:hypothetical protein [Candidatus Scalindua sp.]
MNRLKNILKSILGNINDMNQKETDYNLEVLIRKGYKNGKYDARGMRYVKLDKCEMEYCDNDAELIWFYEDDCYQQCHACGMFICKKCVIMVSEREYRESFKDSISYIDYEENDDIKENEMNLEGEYLGGGHYNHGRITCTNCFDSVYTARKKKIK